ncbi:hypothetical protein K7432_017560 [Basidiobolus ranarum]|uniref:Uncharacterized protein n=1 Tax=Basidiobolus ranarum TaxID=34480 RepID=A0ABR2VL89_9FUNG
MSQIFRPESEKNTHPITVATKDGSVNHVTSSNRVIAFIQWHYGTTNNNRTPEQIEKERYLYGDVVFNRWLLMPAAVLIQFCCGSLYAWSVFNSMIDLHGCLVYLLPPWVPGSKETVPEREHSSRRVFST